MAKKARNIPTVGSSGTCSNGGSKEDKCRNGVPLTKDRVGSTQPICYKYG